MSKEQETITEEVLEEQPVETKEKLHISKATIFRTAMLAAVIINFILQKCGVYNFTINEDILATILDGIFSLGVIISSWWYNNSFSEKALQAQKYLDELRKEDHYDS